MSNTDPNKKPVVNPSPASYKTPAVLLIHTGKPGKSLGSDRGKKTSTQKSKGSIAVKYMYYESEMTHMSVRGIEFSSVFAISLLDVRTVPRVVFFFYYSKPPS
jgi:hypothetical protein